MAGPGNSPDRTLTWSAAIIAVAALVWLARAASAVLIPVAAALFVAALVYPILRWLQRRLPDRFRKAALPLTFGLILAVAGAGVTAVAEAVDEVVDAAPQYEQRLRGLWQQADAAADQNGLPLPTDLLSSADTRRRLGEIAASLARTAWQGASLLIIVVFLILLMLLESAEWRRKMTVRRQRGEAALEIARVCAERVRGYLYVRTVLGVASSLLAGAWLTLLNVDLVLTWMVLTFTLNYIPNVGSVIAVVPPSLMAIVQHGPVRGLIVFGGLVIFEQVIGNVIDPRMQGRRLSLSPVLVMVSLVFWSWAWGVAGALMAAPMTVALVVICAHVPGLEWVAELAGRGDSRGPAATSRP